MSTRPNIIFILADDLGVADLSCYGHPTIRTPHLDRLAHEGARFTQAYANSAVCSATRTALMTGRYQYRLPVGLEEPLTARRVGGAPPGLPPEHPTLPSILRDAGYATDLVGKWHLGNAPDYGPHKSGFQRFWGFRGGAVDYYTHKGPTGKPDLWDDDAPIEKAGYMTDLLGDRCVEVVREHAAAGRPFMISLHFSAPHWPWEAPGDEEESRRLDGKTLYHWDGGTLATYTKIVERMDHQVGRVLDALDDTGIAQDTIVIFTSDNGGERFSHTWPFVGKKTELLEGGLRVPGLVRWPARIPAGQTPEQTCMSMDWMPTLLAAAGCAAHPDYPLDGIDLLPVLAEGRPAENRKLFWRYKANGQRAARDGDFKILKINGNTFLFNVVEDPLERANLKDRRRDVYDALVADWNTWNATMLPEIRESFTDAFDASTMADHIGATAPTGGVEDPKIWPG